MKITELLDNRKETLISYEIIPPARGGSIQEIFQMVEALVPFDPPFIDVTSHSAQVNYEEMPDGSWQRRVKRKRPGTLGLCASIRGRYGIETVPHLLCEGFTREETEDALIELNYLGIKNVMALRGDESGYSKPLPPTRSRNEFAVNLVDQIVDMNQGRYLEPLIDPATADFCVGVAGYPEKHFQAPNLAWDIANLKRKIDAGAEYVTTQMFFDNQHYFAFVDQCREAGITVPIIPGLKILTSKRQMRMLPTNFHVDIPEEVSSEIEAADPADVAEIGINWATKQASELMDAGAPCLHFYIMKTAKHVTQVVNRLRQYA
ncbi:MAG: methylenetetrahydrofolate reductase [NAD(P)H] [Rhodothermales bacterium]|nr:methylenetetrahydrofolate reductase [NAD(P)H] [Rhodothermales bacterium]